MSFNDLERDLGIDRDEWLADEELRRVDAIGLTRRGALTREPRADDLGWYPLGSGPGGWS